MAGLAVTRLALSHFRSHRNTKLDLDGGPIALFGPNGAGKTNILEAVSMLSPGRGLRRARTDDMVRTPESVGWKVSAELESLGHLHEIETRVESGGTRTVLIDGKAAPQIALGRLARMVWLVPTMDRLWLEGADGRRRFLDRMVMSFEPSHAENTLDYEKAMRERNRLLKDQVRDESWYEALEAQMACQGALIQTQRLATIARLVDAQTTAQSAFPRADIALEGADGAEIHSTEDELREAMAESRPRDMAAGRSLVGPHRSDLSAVYGSKDMQAKLCSTGEQKALLVSLVLANARALAEDFGAPPIILLDEVAAHLDADRRAALYAEISALKAQAWMTGTGPELFDTLDADAQRLEVTETGAGSQIEMKQATT